MRALSPRYKYTSTRLFSAILLAVVLDANGLLYEHPCEEIEFWIPFERRELETFCALLLDSPWL